MKMFLRNDHIKVELENRQEPLPSDIGLLEPYHWNRSRTNYFFSIHKLPEVLQVFGKPIDKLPNAVRAAYDSVLARRSAFKHLLLFGPQQDPVVTETLTLRPHQQLAREIAQVYNKFAFYYDTRTGKTPVSISIMYDDIKEHPDHKWLVVAPLILLDLAWGADLEKFTPDLKVSICHASTKKKRIEKIQEDANIYVINTESFVAYKDYFSNITRVIIDESSSMKNKSSNFSKAVVEYSRTCDRVYLLSGTPAPNGAHEYYRQLQSIDYYGIQQSFAQFKTKYFLNLARDVRFEQLVLRDDMAEELHSLIRQYALYMDKEDVLNTPGRVFKEYKMKLPEDLKAAYKQMKSELCTEIGDTTILAASAATKMNKLNQLTSGFLIDSQAKHDNYIAKKRQEDSSKTEWYLLNDYRFKELQKLLDQIGDEQVIIWANYHLEFEFIKQLLGNKCATVYGETSNKDKIEAIKAFKAGKTQYLIANPASADKGLTLTNCHICVYFSLNYSYELFKQSMDRIYGDVSIQPKECEYYVMIASGTIDKVLYHEVLLGKQELSYAILDHLKASDFDE